MQFSAFLLHMQPQCVYQLPESFIFPSSISTNLLAFKVAAQDSEIHLYFLVRLRSLTMYKMFFHLLLFRAASDRNSLSTNLATIMCHSTFTQNVIRFFSIRIHCIVPFCATASQFVFFWQGVTTVNMYTDPAHVIFYFCIGYPCSYLNQSCICITFTV